MSNNAARNQNKYEPLRLKNMNSGLVNWFKGPIVNIIEGELMIQITILSGDNYITSIMPKEEFFTFRKTIGDVVTVAIRSFDVSLMR